MRLVPRRPFLEIQCNYAVNQGGNAPNRSMEKWILYFWFERTLLGGEVEY